MDDIRKRVSRAVSSLVLDHPFFGAMVMGMNIVLDDSVPTACTDCEGEIMLNPQFVDARSKKGLMAVLAHEAMHPMGRYLERRRGRDNELWNVAHDAVINQMLVESKVGDLFDTRKDAPPVLMPELYAQCGGVAEKIYDMLKKEGSFSRGSGGFSVSMPGTGSVVGPFDAPPVPRANGKAGGGGYKEWLLRAANAARAAKSAGNLPGSVKRFIDAELAPKVPWQDVLAQFMERAVVDTRSYARPARRFVAQGLFLPSRSGEALGEVMVAIDMSGSVSRSELTQYMTELASLQERLRPRALTVVYFDTGIRRVDAFGADEPVVLASVEAGGGTSYTDVMELAAKEVPTVLVVVSDMQCSRYGKDPDVPVLWVTDHDKTTAPFGAIINF